MNVYTHCSHNRRYKDDCAECDLVWANSVELPDARKTVQKLLRFYDKASLIELIFRRGE